MQPVADHEPYRPVHGYPLTKFEDGLQSLCSVEDDALGWLETTAAAALQK